MVKSRWIGFLALFVLTSTQFLAIFAEKDSYLRPFYPNVHKTYQDLYDQSQYVIVGSKIAIPDEFIYSIAGWKYLNGDNPILFNAEQPPFGKYLIGLGEMFFNNDRITAPIFNTFSLIALFCLSLLVFKSRVWSVILTAIFGLEKLFLVQLKYAPLLDNIQLFFVLLSFIFYLLYIKNKLSMIPAFLCLGIVMSIKLWVTGLVVYFIWLIHHLIFQRLKRLFFFILLSVFTVVPIALSYLPSLLMGDSLRRVAGVQKYMYAHHQAKIHLDPIGIWNILMTGNFRVPGEGIIKQSVDWQWTWPVLTVLSLLMVWRTIKSKKMDQTSREILGLISIWFVIYIIFLSFGVVLSRYLLPVIPAMYILSMWFIRDLAKKYILK